MNSLTNAKPIFDALDSALRRILKPSLALHGFSFESRSRTFRKHAGQCTQIVNLQVGVRSMEGQFTVNLGIFHPLYNYRVAHGGFSPESPLEYHCIERERLSSLRDTLITRYFRAKIKYPDTFLKHWLTQPSEKWWHCSLDDTAMEQQLRSVEALLLTKGFAWLEHQSDVAIVQAKYSKLKSLSKVLRGVTNV